jgi:2'-5' RNA ligase
MPTLPPPLFRMKALTLSVPPKRKYGCLMAMLPEATAKEIRDWAKANVLSEHLAEEGLGDEIHVTVKYGFEDDSILDEIRRLCQEFGRFPIRLEAVSQFKGNEDGDVLKVDVEGSLLRRLNRLVSSKFANHDKYPTYRPHLTLAYLKPEFSHLYSQVSPPFLGREVGIERLKFSTSSRQKTSIPLPEPIQIKALSWLSTASGGALVKPAKQLAAPKLPPSLFKMFVLTKAAEQHPIGVPWESTNKPGRWFVRRASDGRTVPYKKNPAEGGTAPKKPAAKKPTAQKPVAEKPAVQKPAAKKPAAQKPAAKKPAAKQPKVKPSVDQVKAGISEFIDAGQVTPASAKTIADAISSLTVAQIGILKNQLGLTSSGTKAEQAKKLADKILAKTTPVDKPAGKVTPKDTIELNPEYEAEQPSPVEKVALKEGKAPSKKKLLELAQAGKLDTKDAGMLITVLTDMKWSELHKIAKKMGIKVNYSDPQSELVGKIAAFAVGADPNDIPTFAPVTVADGFAGEPPVKDIKNPSKDKAQVEQLVKWAIDQMGVSPVEMKAQGTPKKIELAKKLTPYAPLISHWEVEYALTNLITQQTNELLPPQFAKPGHGNKPNKLLPDESRPKLSLEEMIAVQKYTGSLYSGLNRFLRGVSTSENQDIIDETHANLQKAFAKAKEMPTPIKVTRGLDIGDADIAKFIEQFEKAQAAGSSVSLLGYQSTSTSSEISHFVGNVQMQITARKGLDLKPYTHYPHESEFLLDHNTQVKVTGIKKVGKRYVLELEQVLDAPVSKDGNQPEKVQEPPKQPEAAPQEATQPEAEAASPPEKVEESKPVDTKPAPETTTPKKKQGWLNKIGSLFGM